MTLSFLTNIISPHQMPLARALVGLLGDNEYRYVYIDEEEEGRANLGWDTDDAVWCSHGDESTIELRDATVLMSGVRAFDLFEKRVKENKKTFYCSERWFKPPLGFLRVFVPSYFKMAKQIVKLLTHTESFYYLPIGIHAARDMARLCGIMHGDLRCLFKAPELNFENRPGGRILPKHEQPNAKNLRKYCLDKMRIWGYFVQSSGLGDRSKGDLSEEENDVKVLWVGRLLDLKRVDTIINAIGKISKSKRITLDIYGLGREEKRLKKIAAKYGDLIKFYPPVPIAQVRKLMRKHDVYVLSSNGYEGWGAVVSEALEEGMKVIGTYEAGSSATILPESNLFHAGDWRKLRELLQGGVAKTEIGLWTVKEAAKVLVSEL